MATSVEWSEAPTSNCAVGGSEGCPILCVSHLREALK